MAEITQLTEDFENGAEGDALTSSSTIFTNISGTAPDATFVDNSYTGDLGMRVAVTAGQVKTYRADYTSETSAWFGFALRFDVNPSTISTVFQMYQNTTVAFAVRLMTDGSIQLRDGLTARFTSPVLTTFEWYWISVKFTPGSSTGARLKVYNRAATQVYDSGDGVATSTAATAMDNLRVGYLAGGGDATYSVDRLRADTTTEIAAVPDSGTSLSVVVDALPSIPEADEVVTLTATPSGGTAPYSYSWSQLGGTSVSLAGSGATRTFTTPALIMAETMSFQCTVTPTSGSAVAEVVEVPVLPHNFWTRQSGTLVPRRVKTMRGGNLVG